VAYVATNTVNGSQFTAIEVRAATHSPRQIFTVSGLERLVLQAWTPDRQALLVTRFRAGSSEPHRLWKITLADGTSHDMNLSMLFVLLLFVVWVVSAALAPVAFSEINPRAGKPLEIRNRG